MKESPKLIPLTKQISEYAQTIGARPALVEIALDGAEHTLSWQELCDAIERVAWFLHQGGITAGTMVVIGLERPLARVVASLAAWRLGACCVPVSPKLTPSERESMLSLARPNLVVSDWPPQAHSWRISSSELQSIWERGPLPPGKSLPHVLCAPSCAIATGASTGKAKLVVQHIPMGYTESALRQWTRLSGQQAGQRQLISGSLWHTLYHSSLTIGLFWGQTIFVLQKFCPELVLATIAKHRIQCMGLVPTMMSKLLECPTLGDTDLSCLAAIFHSGGACPNRVKRAWIGLLGAAQVYEFYSMTEMIGQAAIRGDEWLEHPGSVGHPMGCTVKICDQRGGALPPGQVGEIYCRPQLVTTSYIGQTFHVLEDGYCSVGDLGWMDEAGYLYIADRRVDMIVTGGKNVYTLQVEQALCDFPAVRDAVVVGVPDEMWGRRVHAIIEPNVPAESFPLAELKDFCRQRLCNYKIPHSFEFMDRLPRSEMGKIRRTELAKDRANCG